MKRYFSFALLLALMLSIFSLSFADTVQVGDGTAYSSVLPIYGYYHYSYTQQIYTQAQINHAGPIHKIRFFYRDGSIANNKDWTIWMGHTTKTAFASVTDWEAPVNLTQVFNGDVTNLMPAANNWMEITLTTPFNYNNTDNLLIAVHQYTPDWGSMSWGSFTSGSNTGMYARSDTDNPDPAAPYAAYSMTDKINRIQLIFPTTTPPLAPTLISPLNGGYAIDGESLSWTFTSGGAEVDDYNVYFGTTADPPLVASNLVESTYLPTLQPSTTYYWKVVANNHLGSSPASEVWSFHTPDADQLVESFEDASFPPLGWSGTWSSSTSNPYHGTKTAYRSSSTSTQHTLSTPLLAIEAGSTLSFWARCTSSSGILQIVHSQDGENWTQLGDDITYAATGVWYNHNIDLSSLAGGNYFLGFRNGLVSGSHYVDMVIGPSAAAVAPGVPELTAPEDAATDVSNYPIFTWNVPATGGMPTSYNIYCDANNPPSTLIGTSTATSFVPTAPLPYNSTLYWSVTAVNDVAESAQATPRSFTTMADPTIYDLPWLEDFTATDFPPTHWGRYSGLYPDEALTPATVRWTRANFANVADPANPAARINIYGTGTKHWLVTPPISIPDGAYQLEFDMALTSWSGTNPVDPLKQQDDKFIVFVADNPTMVNPTPLREWNNTGSEFIYNNIAMLGESQVIDLSAHTGVRYIGFYGESTSSTGNDGGDNALFVDNVKVRQTPADPIFTYAPDAIDFGTVMHNAANAPVDVTVSNTGSGTITLAASNISIIGPNAAEFSFGADNLPANLGTGQSVIIPVTVQSTAEGPISATLRMAYGGVNYDVALSANVLPQGILFIGEGTLYNIDTGAPCVYGGYYKNGREQYIITAAELTAAGAQPGLITTIGFNVFDPRTSANLPFTISMGATEATGFTDNEFLTNLTDVYYAESYTPIVGWNQHTLQTPFAWDGNSNLVVQTSYTMLPAVLRNARTYYTYDSANQVLYYRSDTVPWNTVAAGTPSNNRPNMMLHVVEPVEGIPDVPVLTYPADAATALPKTGFNLTWTPGNMANFGIPDGYAVLMSTDIDNIYDDHRWEITNTKFNPVTEGNINFAYNQRWYWTVAAYNIHGEAVVTPPRSFVIETDPTIVALPHAENFDDVTAPAFPRAWTAYKSNSASTLNTSSSQSQTPENSVYMYTRTVGETIQLITPPIGVPINTIKLSFWLRASGTTNYSMKVGTVNASDGSGTFTQVAEIVPTVSGEWVQHLVSFAGYTGTDEYICFQPGTAATYRTYYLDSILLEALPAVDMQAVSLAGPSLLQVGQEASYNLTVLNFGTDAISNYTVNLKDSGANTLATTTVTEELAHGATDVISLNWTPTTVGTYSVYAEVMATGDADESNNATAARNLVVFSETTELLPIGTVTPTTATYAPFNTYWKGFVAETIYLASEIQATSGTIQSIVYYNDFRDQAWTMNAQVYLKNTDLSNLGAGWPEFTDYQLVYSGEITFPAGVNEIVIPLSTPFVYTGGNLSVRTTKSYQATCTDSDNYWLVTPDPNYPNRTRYYSSDTEGNVDHTNPSPGYVVNNVPNVVFVMDPATLVTTVDAPVVDVALVGSDAALTWEAVPYAHSYKVYASEDPYNFGTVPTAIVYTNGATLPTTAGKGFYKATANTYRDGNRGQSMFNSLLQANITVDENPIEKDKDTIRK